jgi:hypothetical protein
MRLRRGLELPLEFNDDTALGGVDDFGGGVDDLDSRFPRAGDSVTEDFTSLLGAVSTRGGTPPQMTTLDAPPFEPGREQRHERLEVAGHGSIERRLDTLSVGRHAVLLTTG